MNAAISLLMDQYDITLPDLPEIGLGGFGAEWNKIMSGIPEVWKLAQGEKYDFFALTYADSKLTADGREFKVRTISHPQLIVLIPSILIHRLEKSSPA